MPIPNPITIRLETENGPKSASVRFPSDEEWIKRQNKRPIIVRDLGRGRTQNTPPDSSHLDEKLFGAIRADGDALDQYEAAAVIEQLARCSVTSVERGAEGFAIAIDTACGEQSCLARIPTQRAVFEFKRSRARAVSLPFNGTEITVNLKAGAALFDQCVSANGSGPWPIIWKNVIADALVTAVESITAGDDGEDFR